jgi:SAM-dependent methyltransferase
MFNNVVNLHDIVVLVGKVRTGQGRRVLSRMFRPARSRIEQSWEHTGTSTTHWWEIPGIQRRWNRLITGNPEVDPVEYVSKKYFRYTVNPKGISLGCGLGNRELKWIRGNPGLTIDAYDLSAERILHAQRLAEQEHLQHRLRFSVGNVFDPDIGNGTYDIVFVEDSLHHFSPLGKVLDRMNALLKPQGYIVVNEFVGPSRFQWTRRQLDAVNALLSLLPERYRKKAGDGSYKTKVYRPGRLSMYLSDPSEAAESSAIPGMLQRTFDILETRHYGGTILHLLFKDIAQNFVANDQETEMLLALCCQVEDLLLHHREIQSDFMYSVCRKKAGPDLA